MEGTFINSRAHWVVLMCDDCSDDDLQSEETTDRIATERSKNKKAEQK